MSNPHKRNVSIALGALVASSTTLLCCVLPSALVTLGAGAVVVGLVAAVPQLVWLSEHKAAVFGIAAAFLIVSGLILRSARNLPCPTDPILAISCLRLRRLSKALYVISALLYVTGAIFAFWTF